MDKTNPKIERVLSLVEPGRRDALRKILATAAYATPVVASFSLDAVAQPVTAAGANQTTCLGPNQGCGAPHVFVGTVKCKGSSVDGAAASPVAQNAHMEFDVEVLLCEELTHAGSGLGIIRGGPSTLAGAGQVQFIHATFPEKNENNETHGFAVTQSPPDYYETGNWAHTVTKKGDEKLKGKSWVLVNHCAAGTSYTLECEYDLTNAVLT